MWMSKFWTLETIEEEVSITKAKVICTAALSAQPCSILPGYISGRWQQQHRQTTFHFHDRRHVSCRGLSGGLSFQWMVNNVKDATASFKEKTNYESRGDEVNTTMYLLSFWFLYLILFCKGGPEKSFDRFLSVELEHHKKLKRHSAKCVCWVCVQTWYNSKQFVNKVQIITVTTGTMGLYLSFFFLHEGVLGKKHAHCSWETSTQLF